MKSDFLISRALTSVAVTSAALVFASCQSDSAQRTLDPRIAAVSVGDTLHIPKREDERTGSLNWSRQNDSSLWASGAKYDSTFVVGLKAPGSVRGFYHGRVLIDATTKEQGKSDLRVRGIPILWEDPGPLPVLKIKVSSLAQLQTLRRLPFIDYMEPARIHIVLASGCQDEPLTHPVTTVAASNGGLDSLSQVMPLMGIPSVWAYAKGDGATVGLTDTGVDHNYDSPLGDGHFSTVDSQGRPSVWQYTQGFQPDQYPTCTHGTRSANIEVAPRDGRGFVGIAYRAKLVSDAFENTPYAWDESLASAAINAVWQMGADVVAMAWGAASWSNQISDTIDLYYYNHNVVFVGAAGTCPDFLTDNTSCPNMGSALFPAEKGEVLAATGAAWDGHRPGDNYDWGTKIEGVLTYTTVGTAGFGVSNPQEINGSSGATAVATGVAALVRGRYPSMNNHDLYMRIVNTSGDRCHNPPPQWRNNMINAVAALGGPCIPRLSGPSYVNITYPARSANASYSVASATGDNSAQFTYGWTNASGSTGLTATYTFWADWTRTSYTDYAEVSVRDPVTGVIVTHNTPVSVNMICPPRQTCH